MKVPRTILNTVDRRTVLVSYSMVSRQLAIRRYWADIRTLRRLMKQPPVGRGNVSVCFCVQQQWRTVYSAVSERGELQKYLYITSSIRDPPSNNEIHRDQISRGEKKGEPATMMQANLNLSSEVMQRLEFVQEERDVWR